MLDNCRDRSCDSWACILDFFSLLYTY